MVIIRKEKADRIIEGKQEQQTRGEEHLYLETPKVRKNYTVSAMRVYRKHFQ